MTESELTEALKKLGVAEKDQPISETAKRSLLENMQSEQSGLPPGGGGESRINWRR